MMAMEGLHKLAPYHYIGVVVRETTIYTLDPPDKQTPESPARWIKTIEDAEAFVQTHYPEADLKAQGKSRKNTTAQRALYWLLSKGLRQGTTSIGERYKRDHSTILHAIRNFEAGFNEHPSDKIIKKLFAND